MLIKITPFTKFFIVCLFVLAFLAFDYKNVSSIKLQKPMELPLILSGTFGELRGNHFHAGIDLKTMGRIGLPVKSIESGFVSRIKISPYGFGKAIYINHPNGLTSVYAHLDDLSPRIKAFTYQLMHEKKSNELDHYLNPDELEVDAAELIGFSGNSGGSGGPHLHFELRESDLQVPLNPLLFNYKIKDNRSPNIYALYFYNFSSKKPYEHYKRLGPSEWKDTVKVNSAEIGLGVVAFDQQDDNYNKNGVYEIELYFDSTLVYSVSMDRISYSETRYIRAHSDPLVKIRNNESVHRCFVLPGDALSIYSKVKEQGKLSLQKGKVHHMEMRVKDINGNVNEVEFFLSRNDTAQLFDSPLELIGDVTGTVYYAQPYAFEGKSWNLSIPAKAFYYDTQLHIEEIDTSAIAVMSNIFKVAPHEYATHRKFSVAYAAGSKFENPEKAVIVRENNGDKSYLTTTYNKGWLSARSRPFGNFYVISDTTRPELLAFEKDPKNLKLKIYARDSQSGITDYHAYINGEWSVCYYDAKNDLFEVECNACFEQGLTDFVLKLADEKKNILLIEKEL